MKPFLKFFFSLTILLLTSSTGSFDSSTKCTTNYCTVYTVLIPPAELMRDDLYLRDFLYSCANAQVFLFFFFLLLYYIFFVGVVAGVWRKQHLLKSIF